MSSLFLCEIAVILICIAFIWHLIASGSRLKHQCQVTTPANPLGGKYGGFRLSRYRSPIFSTRLGRRRDTHESAVAKFFATVERQRPVTFQTVIERYPVLTDYQMEHRRRLEIPVGNETDIEVIAKLWIPFLHQRNSLVSNGGFS